MIQILPEGKQECCGCGACVQVCPAACISMKMDEEGFLYPRTDACRCTDCGRCRQVCPMGRKHVIREGVRKIPKVVGGWHLDENVRCESSSGGAFTLFAEYVIEKGGVVYGCALNADLEAVHIGVERREDLRKLRGSKYVQSKIGTIYQEAEQQLKNGRLVLFTGTPCQAAGFCNFLGKEYKNLYVCDFICHGVPSPQVFSDYIRNLEHKYQDRVLKFQFRCKDKGWSDLVQMGTGIVFEHLGLKRFFPGFRDGFMNGFLDNLFLRPSCYNCCFKGIPKYIADLTIADFWGVKHVKPQLYDGRGTSLVLIHNLHGETLFACVKERFFYKECEFQTAVRRNPTLMESAEWNPKRSKFFKDYQTKKFTYVKRKYLGAYRWLLHKTIRLLWCRAGKFAGNGKKGNRAIGRN